MLWPNSLLILFAVIAVSVLEYENMDLYIFLSNVVSPETFLLLFFFTFISLSRSGLEHSKPQGKIKQVSA